MGKRDRAGGDFWPERCFSYSMIEQAQEAGEGDPYHV
jgi:hypothetical protein